MPRPATGEIHERRGVYGTRWALRFRDGSGRRRYVTLDVNSREDAEAALEELGNSGLGKDGPDRVHVTGVCQRHSRGCATQRSARHSCNCEPRYQAWVWSSDAQRKMRKTFPDIRSALQWREQMRGMGPNPITEFVALVEARVAQQESQMGEALPHLLLAREFLRRLHARAESEAQFLWREA